MSRLQQNSILCLLLTTGLNSCKSLTEPDFYRMSPEELDAYNLTIVGQEQVRCVQIKITVDDATQRICGTLEEVQNLSQPISPGARIDSFFPRFPTDSRSRATNPSLKPTVQQQPL